jgi:hypothetical protein
MPGLLWDPPCCPASYNLFRSSRTQRWDGVKSEQRVNLQAGTDQAAEFSSPQSETRMIDGETICVG